MKTAVILLALWIVAATIIGLLPRRFHKPGAIPLMILLIPLVPLVWIKVNPFIAVMFLLGVASILRWPLYFFGRWCNRQAARVTDHFHD